MLTMLFSPGVLRSGSSGLCTTFWGISLGLDLVEAALELFPGAEVLDLAFGGSSPGFSLGLVSGSFLGSSPGFSLGLNIVSFWGSSPGFSFQ